MDVYRLSMHIIQMFYVCYMDVSWVVYGVPIDVLLMFYGCSMDVNELSLDILRIFDWCSMHVQSTFHVLSLEFYVLLLVVYVCYMDSLLMFYWVDMELLWVFYWFPWGLYGWSMETLRTYHMMRDVPCLWPFHLIPERRQTSPTSAFSSSQEGARPRREFGWSAMDRPAWLPSPVVSLQRQTGRKWPVCWYGNLLVRLQLVSQLAYGSAQQ